MSQDPSLSNVLVAASLRNDQWRQLNAAARAWASAGESARGAARDACAKLFDTVTRLEYCWAYPGERLLAALRDALDGSDAALFARLVQKVSGALLSGDLFCEYQPVVDLAKRELLGVEALVRWNHPEQGLVMPGAFIAAAEESGQIVELGRWVLSEACRAVKAWRDGIIAGDGLRVAINISGRHLQHADLVADVRKALESSGLEPENLVIELTESTIMHNTELNLERFRALKALGIKIAIDDFGMGYSSLSYLHRFPIDILKIDRAFVSRLTSQDEGPDLARAVVMLGETLGLETVAEGIENEDQIAKLLKLGCVAGQGFLFARASSLDAVTATPFATRRAELRQQQAIVNNLTATGRFREAGSRAVARIDESGPYPAVDVTRRARRAP